MLHRLRYTVTVRVHRLRHTVTVRTMGESNAASNEAMHFRVGSANGGASAGGVPEMPRLSSLLQKWHAIAPEQVSKLGIVYQPLPFVTSNLPANALLQIDKVLAIPANFQGDLNLPKRNHNHPGGHKQPSAKTLDPVSNAASAVAATLWQLCFGKEPLEYGRRKCSTSGPAQLQQAQATSFIRYTLSREAWLPSGVYGHHLERSARVETLLAKTQAQEQELAHLRSVGTAHEDTLSNYAMAEEQTADSLEAVAQHLKELEVHLHKVQQRLILSKETAALTVDQPAGAGSLSFTLLPQLQPVLTETEVLRQQLDQALAREQALKVAVQERQTMLDANALYLQNAHAYVEHCRQTVGTLGHGDIALKVNYDDIVRAGPQYGGNFETLTLAETQEDGCNDDWMQEVDILEFCVSFQGQVPAAAEDRHTVTVNRLLRKVMEVAAWQITVVPITDSNGAQFKVTVMPANRDDTKKGTATSYRTLLLKHVTGEGAGLPDRLLVQTDSVRVKSANVPRPLSPKSPMWLLYSVRNALSPLFAINERTCRRVAGMSLENTLAMCGNASALHRTRKHFHPERKCAVRDFGRPLLSATRMWTALLEWASMAAAVPEALWKLEAQIHDPPGYKMLRLIRAGVYDWLRPSKLTLAMAALRGGIANAAACYMANIGTRLDADRTKNERSFTLKELQAKVVTCSAQLAAAKAGLKAAQVEKRLHDEKACRTAIQVAEGNLTAAKNNRHLAATTKDKTANLTPGFMSNTSTAIKAMFRRTLNIFQTTPLGSGCDLVKAVELSFDCMKSRGTIILEALNSLSGESRFKIPAVAGLQQRVSGEHEDEATESQHFWTNFFKEQDKDASMLKTCVDTYGIRSDQAVATRAAIAGRRCADQELLLHILFDALVVSKGPRTFSTTTGAIQITSSEAERMHLNNVKNLSNRALKRYQANLIRKGVKRASRASSFNRNLLRAAEKGNMTSAATFDFFAERLRDHHELQPLFRCVRVLTVSSGCASASACPPRAALPCASEMCLPSTVGQGMITRRLLTTIL